MGRIYVLRARRSTACSAGVNHCFHGVQRRIGRYARHAARGAGQSESGGTSKQFRNRTISEQPFFSRRADRAIAAEQRISNQCRRSTSVTSTLPERTDARVLWRLDAEGRRICGARDEQPAEWKVPYAVTRSRCTLRAPPSGTLTGTVESSQSYGVAIRLDSNGSYVAVGISSSTTNLRIDFGRTAHQLERVWERRDRKLSEQHHRAGSVERLHPRLRPRRKGGVPQHLITADYFEGDVWDDQGFAVASGSVSDVGPDCGE